MAPSQLELAYRAQLDHVRKTVAAEVAATFGEEVTEADITASFERFAKRAAPRIEAGQSAAQLLTVAFLEALAEEQGLAWEPAPEDDDLPGTTVKGEPLERGMGGIAGLVLAAIGRGEPPGAALDIGRTYVERFADNEVRSAADREQERQEAAPEIVGWRGEVRPDSCERCQVNEGEHDLSEETYRHPSCGCERIPIFATTA